VLKSRGRIREERRTNATPVTNPSNQWPVLTQCHCRTLETLAYGSGLALAFPSLRAEPSKGGVAKPPV
jgi:hypothetical protein